MTGDVRIVLRRLRDVAAAADPAHDDPEGIAPFTPGKLRAFRANPLRGGPDDPAQLLALAGKRVIGRVDVFPGEITAFGEPVPVYWGSALWVSPAYRSTAAGAMLVLRLSSLGRSVAGCGFSEAAFPIYRAVRWVPFDMPRYVLLRRSRPVLEKFVSAGGRVPRALCKPMARGLACFADPVLAAHRTIRRASRTPPRRDLTCHPRNRFPADLDETLRTPEAPVFCHRSARHLDWLLASDLGDGRSAHPRNRKHLYLVEDRHGRRVAYFLIQVRHRAVASRHAFPDVVLGSLQDWFVFEPTAVTPADLVTLAARELARLDVDALEICAAEPGMEAACRELGLRPFGVTHFMFRAARGSRLASPDLARRELWRITPAEGDGCLA